MGGFGSGEWRRPQRRQAVEESPRISIRLVAPWVEALERERATGVLSLKARHPNLPDAIAPLLVTWPSDELGSEPLLLVVERFGDDYYVRVQPDALGKDELRPSSFTILLTSTPSNLPGCTGRRWWFYCPKRGCSRRCIDLYAIGPLWSCRTCQGLSYVSRRRSREHTLNFLETVIDRFILATQVKGITIF